MFKHILLSSLVCFSGFIFCAEVKDNKDNESFQVPAEVHKSMPRNGAELEEWLNNCCTSSLAELNADMLRMEYAVNHGPRPRPHCIDTVDKLEEVYPLRVKLMCCKELLSMRKNRLQQLKSQLTQTASDFAHTQSDLADARTQIARLQEQLSKAQQVLALNEPDAAPSAGPGPDMARALIVPSKQLVPTNFHHVSALRPMQINIDPSIPRSLTSPSVPAAILSAMIRKPAQQPLLLTYVPDQPKTNCGTGSGQ